MPNQDSKKIEEGKIPPKNPNTNDNRGKIPPKAPFSSKKKTKK
jgi:hypothetical protein